MFPKIACIVCFLAVGCQDAGVVTLEHQDVAGDRVPDTRAAGSVNYLLVGDDIVPAPSPDVVDSQPAAGESKIPIYISPFYDSNGPTIRVGPYSTELAEATTESMPELVTRMKNDWAMLPVELMYVTSIRLFDLGFQDSAVYWFYSAQYRSRLFMSVIAADSEVTAGSAAGEWLSAQNAFFELAGPHINGFAFSKPAMLQDTIRLVVSESEPLPQLRSIYPALKFKNNESWDEENQGVAKGLKKLLELIAKNPQLTEELPEDGESIDIREIVSKGGDVNARYQGARTLLHVAITVGDRDAYKLLLENGANPNLCDAKGASVVHLAARQPEVYWLREAIEHGGNPDQPNTGHQYYPNTTPIFYAIEKQRVDNVLELIASGADVNHVDDRHRTPLYRCMQVGLYSAMIKLLEAGADPAPPEPAQSILQNGWFSENFESTFAPEGDHRDYYELKAILNENRHAGAPDG
jgi:hypothetical protein